VGGGLSEDCSHDKHSIDVMKKALEMGYTHIDTAEMYGSGHTEKLVGKAIESFNRQDLFITSKVWSSNLRYQDVLHACYSSMERMKIEYIDLYLIHWPNPDIPMTDTFRALNELIDRKYVKYVGVSNFSVKQMREAGELSSTPLITNQVEYNVLYREPEINGVLVYCQQNNIILTAYKPLGRRGALSNPLIIQVAEKYDINPAQVAIIWLVSKPRVITIPMSLNEKHLHDNLEAADLEISKEDLDRLDDLKI
jgi:diketogulonate reductase-like aldo/keto reductase